MLDLKLGGNLAKGKTSHYKPTQAQKNQGNPRETKTGPDKPRQTQTILDKLRNAKPTEAPTIDIHLRNHLHTFVLVY